MINFFLQIIIDDIFCYTSINPECSRMEKMQ